MAEWRVYTLIPIHWKGQDIPAGAIVTGSSPEDDKAAAYWSMFNAWGLSADDGGGAETPPPPPDDKSDDAGGTAPMSSQQSHVVGRRRAR